MSPNRFTCPTSDAKCSKSFDADRARTVAFTGHRAYDGSAAALLRRTVMSLYDEGYRTFLDGMAVGFDMAAAEAVLACRAERPDLRLVAVIPFRDQEKRFRPTDKERYARILTAADDVVTLSKDYFPGCYAVRNDFLVDRAAAVVAWYDGSAGGTRYTWEKAQRRGLRLIGLHPDAPQPAAIEPTLF